MRLSCYIHEADGHSEAKTRSNDKVQEPRVGKRHFLGRGQAPSPTPGVGALSFWK